MLNFTKIKEIQINSTQRCHYTISYLPNTRSVTTFWVEKRGWKQAISCIPVRNVNN